MLEFWVKWVNYVCAQLKLISLPGYDGFYGVFRVSGQFLQNL